MYIYTTTWTCILYIFQNWNHMHIVHPFYGSWACAILRSVKDFTDSSVVGLLQFCALSCNVSSDLLFYIYSFNFIQTVSSWLHWVHIWADNQQCFNINLFCLEGSCFSDVAPSDLTSALSLSGWSLLIKLFPACGHGSASALLFWSWRCKFCVHSESSQFECYSSSGSRDPRWQLERSRAWDRRSYYFKMNRLFMYC